MRESRAVVAAAGAPEVITRVKLAALGNAFDDTRVASITVKLPRQPGLMHDAESLDLMSRRLDPAHVDVLTLNVWANRDAIRAHIKAELSANYANFSGLILSDAGKAARLKRAERPALSA